MQVIGLTGGIASGKSTVSEFFRARGVPVIDADKLGHRAYEPGTGAHPQLVAAFGDDILAPDGTIDRRVLGGKVFGNDAEMKRLTDIVWPAIRGLAEEEIAALEGEGHPIVLLEAAVMLEAGWEDLAHEVWVVTVEPPAAVARLAERNGLSEADAQARIDSQLSNAERVERADVVIENNGTLDELESRLHEAWNSLQERIAAPEGAGGNA